MYYLTTQQGHLTYKLHKTSSQSGGFWVPLICDICFYKLLESIDRQFIYKQLAIFVSWSLVDPHSYSTKPIFVWMNKL